MATASRQTEDELIDALRERGLRVTPQRLILHRVLAELGRHATADEILSAAGERLPNVSAPTVYATLELFEELGLVRRVPVDGGPVLYDPRADEHHHLACRSCGRVVDLDATVDATPALRAARRAGARPERADLLLTGLCPDCARAVP
jgi:Fe2+ or Zn2+ uptake regulation protein